MYRDDRLVIKLTTNEKEAAERLAQAERLPLSTLTRKILLDKAAERGLLQMSGEPSPGGGSL